MYGHFDIIHHKSTTSSPWFVRVLSHAKIQMSESFFTVVNNGMSQYVWNFLKMCMSENGTTEIHSSHCCRVTHDIRFLIPQNCEYFLSKGHSTYIRIENPLHKQSKIGSICFKQDVLELATLRYMYRGSPDSTNFGLPENRVNREIVLIGDCIQY